MIKMHDVLFGEFIEVTDGESYIIIDCGCGNTKKFLSEKGQSFQSYVQTQNNLYKGKKVDLMISHFHEDHFNGFEYFKNLNIGNIYLPYISSDGQSSFIFKEALISYIFASNRMKLKIEPYINQVEFILNLRKNNLNDGISPKLSPVGIGNIFDSGGYKHEILWPPKPECNIITKTRYIDDVLESLSRINEFDSVVDTINKLSDMYIQFWEEITEQNNSNYDDYSKLLNSYYDIVNGIDRNVIKETKGRIKLINNIIKGMNTDINKTSIVDLITKDNKEIALFTGDITNNIYDQYISKRVNKVSVLKVPHHGTNVKLHYSKVLPKADNVLISNGNYGNRKILQEYSSYLKNGFIYCTHGIQKNKKNTCKIKSYNRNNCPKKCLCTQGPIVIH